MTMTTIEAANAFLETDAPLKAMAARHDEAVKVLKEWFREHPGKLKYRGMIGYSKQGPWQGLSIALATVALGDKLASCQEDRYRIVLTALRGPPT